jgi:hypothetical protein
MLRTAYERWRADALQRSLVFEKCSCSPLVLETGWLAYERHAKLHSRMFSRASVTAITVSDAGYLGLRQRPAKSRRRNSPDPQPFHP